jgi:hypothetical protein
MTAYKDAETSQAAPPPVALTQMTAGGWVTQAVYVAAKLGIADLLAGGPKNCDELAALTQSHSPSLYRVLRALASVGVFRELNDQKFELTPLSEHLRTDIPGSLRAWAMLVGENFHWNVWGELAYSVKTGEPAWNQVHGMGPFEFFHKNPEAAQVFDEAMTNFSAPEIPAVLDAYDFSPYRTIVDVAGNQGALLAAILKAYPEANAILFDLPPVIERAQSFVEREGVADRCRLVGGDFFESVPEGGDLYIFKRIVHGWYDDGAAKMLQNCHRAMNANGKLLVIEMVIPPGNEPFFGKWLDLLMLLIGGMDRTEAEYRDLFAASGFELTRVIPTSAPVSIVEGVRV